MRRPRTTRNTRNAFRYWNAYTKEEPSMNPNPNPTAISVSTRGVVLVAVVAALIIAASRSEAGAWGPVDTNQSDLQWVQNCEIFSATGVEALNYFGAYSGDPTAPYRSDVCAREYVDFGSNVALKVPMEATALTDVAIVSPEIALGRLSKTSECVYDTGGLTTHPNLHASKACPQQTAMTAPDVALVMPTPDEFNAALPFPLTIPTTPTTTVVTDGDTLELAPGNYGDLIVGEKSLIIFKSPGTYNFNSIRSAAVNSPMHVKFVQPGVVVNVVEYVLLGHRSNWNVTATTNVKLQIAGAGPYAVDGWGADEPAFVMQGDGMFFSCWVYSPNGTQVWKGHSHAGPDGGDGAFTTQSFSNLFVDDSRLSVRMKHPQDESCYSDQQCVWECVPIP